MNNKVKIPIIIIPIIIIAVVFASMFILTPDTSMEKSPDLTFDVDVEELSDITVTGVISHWQPIDGPAFAITPENNLTIPMDNGRIYLYGNLNSNLDGKKVIVTGKIIENYAEYQTSKHGGAFGGDSSTSVIFVTEIGFVDESITGVVHGTINADTPNVIFKNVTIYVQLVDASLQDVPSILLGKTILEDVSYNSNLRYAGILYSVTVDFEINESATYYVSAHADIDGDGQTSKGDWVSMTAHPVLSHGSGNESSIILSLVE